MAKKTEEKWKIAKVDITEIEGTELNANSMSEKEFKKLVDNIRKSGLSSMIACYKRKTDGKYVIISGNHRYRACVKLGYHDLNILYANEEELLPDEIIALQLSHNSLHGSDDKGILKRLLEEITSIDYKEFAHISMDDFKEIDIFSTSIVPVSEHFTVSLILYKPDIENLGELLQIIDEKRKTSEYVILADGNKTQEQFLSAMSKAKKDFEIKSTGVAFSKILELAMGNVQEKVTNVTKKEEIGV